MYFASFVFCLFVCLFSFSFVFTVLKKYPNSIWKQLIRSLSMECATANFTYWVSIKIQLNPTLSSVHDYNIYFQRLVTWWKICHTRLTEPVKLDISLYWMFQCTSCRRAWWIKFPATLLVLQQARRLELRKHIHAGHLLVYT